LVSPCAWGPLFAELVTEGEPALLCVCPDVRADFVARAD
jgi:hypothetical protein